MNVNFEQMCKELYQKEVARFEEADIDIKHDYIIHENIHSLDIFILIADLGSMAFIKYSFNKNNLEDVKRKEHIISPGSANVLKRLLTNE
ncbi:hypothetical protein P5F75_07570 [Caldifermentibacillus hisashii]|jgi:hypothetical protein|uniref:hypothetical protein n=1 Tax=Caldifermentibacillus hisashii TaxID=996558 RepID=UPI002E1B2332|nr:hypothetical protein [Caldifermentibacillus hisashii]